MRLNPPLIQDELRQSEGIVITLARLHEQQSQSLGPPLYATTIAPLCLLTTEEPNTSCMESGIKHGYTEHQAHHHLMWTKTKLVHSSIIARVCHMVYYMDLSLIHI